MVPPHQDEFWRLRISGLVLVSSLFLPGIAFAQLSTGAAALFLGPSPRTEALGRQCTAVFWGPFPDFWSNPALLGYHAGLGYEWTRLQLVPSLADDVFFRSNRLTIGGWGVALSLSGVPFENAGGILLDYGENVFTDPEGNVIGTFHSYDEVNSWGVGINGVEFVESLRSRGSFYPLSRYFDVSFGYTHKNVEVDLLPETPGRPAIRDEIGTNDYGFAGRLTPYNTIDHTGSFSELDATIGLRLDLSAGWGRINDESETIQPGSNPDPVVRMENMGLAVRGSVGLPKQILADLDSKGVGWLGEALSPLLALGFNWDNSQDTYVVEEGGAKREGLLLASQGWELTLLNVVSIRRGEYDAWDGPLDDFTTADRSTSGWGLALDVPGIGGVHYDRATVEIPAAGLADHEPTAFGFWVDPIGLWNVIK